MIRIYETRGANLCCWTLPLIYVLVSDVPVSFFPFHFRSFPFYKYDHPMLHIVTCTVVRLYVTTLARGHHSYNATFSKNKWCIIVLMYP